MATSTRKPPKKKKPRAARRRQPPCPLWAAYQRDKTNEALRNQLVERYLPIVRAIAVKLSSQLPFAAPHGVDDLAGYGAMGLLGAVEGFDPRRGFKFETYCVLRIRGAMLDGIRGLDWVPRLLRSKASTLARARAKIDAALRRPPTALEVAEHLMISVAELERLELETSPVAISSLHAQRFETDSGRWVQVVDLTVDERAIDPVDRLSRQETFADLIKGCNRAERLLLIGYYQLGQTMKQIGASLGLSESRVSQMHSALLIRLRERLGRRCGQEEARSA
jgi:RNA polymerase sigma factor for flagellar operon FliA